MKTLLNCWPMVKAVDFQGCWEALIACIGNGKIVQLHSIVYVLLAFCMNGI